MQSRELTFKYPNATVRVHIPDLAPEEKEKRTKEIKRSAEMILREVIRNEYRTLNSNNA